MKSVLSSALAASALFFANQTQAVMLQGIEGPGEWVALAQTYASADAYRSQCLVIQDSNYKASIFYPVIGTPLAQ